MKILSGRFGQSYGTPSTWHLHTGNGERTASFTIPFPSAFASPPQVFLGLSHVDSSRERNLRVRVAVAHVDTNSFELRVITWADSVLYGVEVNWLAYGD